MKTIQKQLNNIGGVANLWVIPIDFLDSITASSTDGVYDIVFSNTAEMYDITVISESLRIQDNLRQANAGYYHEVQIQASVAKDTPELQLALQELLNIRLVAVVRDFNNRYKLIGNLTESIRMNYQVDSGAQVSDLQHAKLVFDGRFTSPSIFINDPFAVD